MRFGTSLDIAEKRTDLKEQVNKAPNKPGVYMFVGPKNKIIYVGKAQSLKSRLRSYFSGPTLSPKTRLILTRAERIEFIITSSEKEALLLENQFIKQHKPPYNIKLRDDKDYICLKIDLEHEFPRIMMTRRIKPDGAKYFGPYSSSQAVRETLKWLQKIFPLRSCKDRELLNRTRPCILYSIGRCNAPCVRYISKEDYEKIVKQAIMFLEGRAGDLVEDIRKKMETAAENLEFEHAAWLRDRIAAIEKTLEGQKIVSAKFENKDAIGMWRELGSVEVAVLSIRQGKLIDTRSMGFSDKGWTDEEVITAFLQQYYVDRIIPGAVLLPALPENPELFTQWLSERANRKVKIEIPKSGENIELVKLAAENAQALMYSRRERERDFEKMLERITNRFRLTNSPRVVDAFDISTLFGAFSAGSRIRFLDGKPDKSHYRRYKIKSDATDDTARMSEVISRYFEREKDDMPDMLLIDGGKGQLKTVERVRNFFGLKVPLVAIAKGRTEDEPDHFYLVGRANPVRFAKNSSEYNYLCRIRDEAHRFAIEYHRKLHKKGSLTSILDEIGGIGSKRKRALIERFGTIDKIAKAKIGELASIGIPANIAQTLKSAINNLLKDDKSRYANK